MTKALRINPLPRGEERRRSCELRTSLGLRGGGFLRDQSAEALLEVLLGLLEKLVGILRDFLQLPGEVLLEAFGDGADLLLELAAELLGKLVDVQVEQGTYLRGKLRRIGALAAMAVTTCMTTSFMAAPF